MTADKYYNVKYEYKLKTGGKTVGSFMVHASDEVAANQKANAELVRRVPYGAVSSAVTEIKCRDH